MKISLVDSLMTAHTYKNIMKDIYLILILTCLN